MEDLGLHCPDSGADYGEPVLRDPKITEMKIKRIGKEYQNNCYITMVDHCFIE